MNRLLSLRLDEEVIDKFDRLAEATERSREWLIARAVRQFVEHETWQVEATKQALDKLNKGNACFVSQEFVEAWVESWE